MFSILVIFKLTIIKEAQQEEHDVYQRDDLDPRVLREWVK